MTSKNQDKNGATDIAALRQKAVESALALAAETSWHEVSFTAIAEHSGVGLKTLYDLFADRSDILAAYGRSIDRRVLEAAAINGDTGPASHDLSPRDRLFDLLMERFDILGEQRAGVCAILRSFRGDPKQAVISLPHLCRSMSWALDAAGLSASGPKGALRLAGLTGLYLKTLKVWMDDDSPDLSKTMAALDKNMEQAERWAGNFRL